MLAQRGWAEITVIEKRAAADYYEPDKSFSYLIDGRGQKCTDLLGLTEQLAAIGVANTEFYLTQIQANGKRKTAKLPLVDPTYKPAYWLPRRAFVQLIYQEIKQNWNQNITVLFNTECAAINKNIKDSSITLEVVLEAATENNASLSRRLEPKLLIGCDGVQSIVRSTLNLWDGSGRFEMQQYPSPSSGLRYKVLSLPPNFPLNAEATERAVPTMAYAIRSQFRERQRTLSLGLLPIKDPEAARTANLITRPNHQLWQLQTSEQVSNFLEQSFPQLPLRQILSSAEIDRFANSNGGAFPIPQFCTGLHYLLSQPPDAKPSATALGIVLLGDAVHCFPPDIGQGVNSALEDVFMLNQALTDNEDDLIRSLASYEVKRSADVCAVVWLAQMAAPWQYNQAPLRGWLWAVGFALRLGLSKFLPFISPPAFLLIQNYQLSYQEIWLKNQRTVQIFSVMLLIGLISLLVIAALPILNNLT